MRFKRFIFSVIFLCCGLFGLSYSAFGAVYQGSLKQIRGPVLIDRGHGYAFVRSGARIQSGDRLLLLENASAAFVHKNGCLLRLFENSVFVVAAVDGSSCEAGVNRIVGTFVAQAIGLDDPDTAVDTTSGGFGAIGAEPEQQLTPSEINEVVGEQIELAPEEDATAVTGVEDAQAPTVATDVDEPPPLEEESPALADESQQEESELTAQAPVDEGEGETPGTTSLFAGGGVTIGAAVAGGIGLVAALAGGGGGGGSSGGGAPSPPISPQ